MTSNKIKNNLLTVILYLSLGLSTLMANDNNDNKYSNYLDSYSVGRKCEGYDFDPERVVVIDLTNTEVDNKEVLSIKKNLPANILDISRYPIRNYVVLDNGKKFRITAIYDPWCPSIRIEGKDGYKQLPNGCSFAIGTICIAPPPANCKKFRGVRCLDENITQQETKLFQWEATNKGWIKLDTFIMSYDDSDIE